MIRVYSMFAESITMICGDNNCRIIKHALTIMDLLVDLKGRGKTIIVSVHDLNLARRYCDTVVIIYEGGVFFAGTPDEALSRENIKQVFGVETTEIRSDSRSFLYFH